MSDHATTKPILNTGFVFFIREFVAGCIGGEKN